MELKELPREETNEQEMTETQKTDLFNAIVRGKDVTEVVHTSRGDFEIKFPRMRDLESIGRLTALRQNGIPSSSFDPYTYSLMQKIATLDILVVSGAAWYENAKKENKHGFTWQEIPSQAFIEELYAKAYEFRNKIQNLFESNTERTDTELATDGNSKVDNEPGLFDGLKG